MKRMLPRSRRIEIAQAAARRGADVATEVEYGTPGCRFCVVCRMLRGGATDEEVRTEYPEMKEDTLRVYRKYIEGRLSRGRQKCTALQLYGERKPMAKPRRELAYELFERGYTNEEAARRMEISEGSIARYRTDWWKKGRTEG